VRLPTLPVCLPTLLAVTHYFTSPPLSAVPSAGVVTSVAYHPREPILASCGNDKKVYLGELAV